MKHFKRAAAMLLAVVLSLCLAVTAFAADAPLTTGNLTVTGSGLYIPGEGSAAGTGKKVTAIRMFTARVTGDATASTTNTIDSYVLEEAWKGFFTDDSRFSAVKTAGGITDSSVTAENITKEALSDAAVAYVKSLNDAGKLATFAHDAQKWARVATNNTTLDTATLIRTETANTANDSSDVTKGTATFSGLTAGYYLVFPEGGSTGNGNRGTDAILVNVPKNGGVTEQTIKSTYPTVEKKVQTSTDGEFKPNGTAQVGDTVTFTLTAKVPDMTDYNSYKFIFHDTLSNGLQYVGPVKVEIDGEVKTAVTDYTVTEPTAPKNELTVSFDNLKLVASEKIGKDIVVTYTAKITKEAVKDDPAKNTVYLEYSNNPGTDELGKSNPDESKVYTYDINIFKFYKDGETEKGLANATFKLTSSEESTSTAIELVKETGAGLVYHVKGDNETGAVNEVTTGDDGKITIKGLKAGTYYLHETIAPTGYNKLKKPIKIEITVTDDYTNPSYKVDDKPNTDNTIKVENVKGVMLPETGSIGTIGLTVLGVAVVLLGVFAPRKKKKENQ